MRVLITGGAGFIGTCLARRILERGRLTGPSGEVEPVDGVVLLDIAHGSPALVDDRIQRVTGDGADVDLLRTVLADDFSIFHLASMVSAACEVDFDSAIEVNLGSTRAVLEAARARSSAPRVVFASSLAVFGGEVVAGPVSEATRLIPETTYGMTKAIGELLVNDYTRKGFVDGRSARLPTVIVRPGRPNAAASSWVSGIFREPLAGVEAVVPVDLDIRVPVSGYRTVAENLIRLHEVDGAALGADRSLNLPAVAPTPRDMVAALRRAAGDRPLGPIVHRPDPLVAQIFATWPQEMSFDRATKLDLVSDDGLESIIHAYLQDFGQ